jgi:chorismate synthase
MNTIGNLFRVSVFGASHGSHVGVTIDGVPPGIPLSLKDFEADLSRRKGGQQIGTTPRVEDDEPIIISGWFNSFTTGSPLTIMFTNNNTRSQDYEQARAIPRPSHADFVAHHKYKGFEDYRGGGHFSARLTVGIVAAGVIAKKILDNIHIEANVIAIGGDEDLNRGLQRAIAAKDSVGGLIACTATGLPIGWGEPFWDSVESKLAQAYFSIPAVKGVEFGAGFAAANMLGTEHNDSMMNAQGLTKTNNAGGIVGGISNGNPLVCQIAIKPTASTPKVQQSFNTTTQKIENFSIKGRHDLCVALRAPVIVEAMTAIVLADFKLLHNAQQIN